MARDRARKVRLQADSHVVPLATALALVVDPPFLDDGSLRLRADIPDDLIFVR